MKTSDGRRRGGNWFIFAWIAFAGILIALYFVGQNQEKDSVEAVPPPVSSAPPTSDAASSDSEGLVKVDGLPVMVTRYQEEMLANGKSLVASMETEGSEPLIDFFTDPAINGNYNYPVPTYQYTWVYVIPAKQGAWEKPITSWVRSNGFLPSDARFFCYRASGYETTMKHSSIETTSPVHAHCSIGIVDPRTGVQMVIQLWNTEVAYPSDMNKPDEKDLTFKPSKDQTVMLVTVLLPEKPLDTKEVNSSAQPSQS